MTLDDYLAYWARDADGRYCGTRPEAERRDIWRRKLWAELKLLQYGPDVSGSVRGNVRPAGVEGTPGVPFFLKKGGGKDEDSNNPMTMPGGALGGFG